MRLMDLGNNGTKCEARIYCYQNLTRVKIKEDQEMSPVYLYMKPERNFQCLWCCLESILASR